MVPRPRRAPPARPSRGVAAVAAIALGFASRLETLVRDGPRIAVIAWIGVVLLAIGVLGPRAAWRALAAQGLALAWFAGAVGALGMKINFAGTGAAVALCSLTTIIGYSSLLSSTNPALRSFGILADIGEVTCLTAALVVLPALARRGWRARRAAPGM